MGAKEFDFSKEEQDKVKEIYREYAFIFPKFESVGEGRHRLKLTILNLDRKSPYHSDLLIISSLAIAGEVGPRDIWKIWLNDKLITLQKEIQGLKGEKEIQEKLLRSIQAHFPFITKIDKKSDYYIYFYFHGLSLLNDKGTFCFITSNSWLDVGYGKDLQEFLLKYCHVKAIYDNQAKRSFEHADVNTIIALFGAPQLSYSPLPPFEKGGRGGIISSAGRKIPHRQIRREQMGREIPPGAGYILYDS